MTPTVLRLFIAGSTPSSQLAVMRVRMQCEEMGPDLCRLEIIDVLEAPEAAERHRILATPALLRLQPLPVVQLIGDMSDLDRLKRVLEAPASSRVM